MRRLQEKLIYIVLIGVIAASVLTGGSALLSFGTIERSNSQELLIQQTKENAVYFNEVFGGVETQVRTLGGLYTLEAVSQLQTNDQKSVDAYVKSMEEIARTVADYNETVGSVYLHIAPELVEHESGFFLCRENGSQAMSDLPLTHVEEFSKDDTAHVGWYYQPIESKEAMWIGPYFNRNNDMLTLSFVEPLYVKDGSLLGVVGIDIDFQQLRNRISKMTAYQSGYSAMINAKGELIYTPHGEALPKELIAAVTSSKDEVQLGSHTVREQQYAVASVRLQTENYLMLLVPEAEFYESQRRVMYMMILLTISVSAMMVLVLTGLIQRIFSVSHADALTKAANKNAYIEKTSVIDAEIKGNKKLAFYAVVFDINALKRTNDELGHSAGDEMIVEAYRLIREAFPKCEIFRIGGDEFAIIDELGSAVRAELLLKRFRMKMNRRISGYKVGSKEIVISSGMAVFDPRIDLRCDDVFKRADQDMYREKAKFYSANSHLERRR